MYASNPLKLTSAMLASATMLGCASPPVCPGPEVVEVTRTEYVAIPRHLLIYDDVSQPPIVTNGDLLEAYRIWREAAEERGRRLDEVANLQGK
jgi:hypothetical protein